VVVGLRSGARRHLPAPRDGLPEELLQRQRDPHETLELGSEPLEEGARLAVLLAQRRLPLLELLSRRAQLLRRATAGGVRARTRGGGRARLTAGERRAAEGGRGRETTAARLPLAELVLEAVDVVLVRVARLVGGAELGGRRSRERRLVDEVDGELAVEVAAVADLAEEVVLLVLQVLQQQVGAVEALVRLLRLLLVAADRLPHRAVHLLQLEEEERALLQRDVRHRVRRRPLRRRALGEVVAHRAAERGEARKVLVVARDVGHGVLMTLVSTFHDVVHLEHHQSPGGISILVSP